MFPWSDAQAPDAPRYAVGDRVYSGKSPGTVVSVDAEHHVVSVEWDDAEGKYGPIKYPADTDCLRKALPWEK